MFEDRLIAAVKANTCLYDKSLITYRNKRLKEKAWIDVAALVGGDVEQCQGRWRSLRDRFLKELQKKPKSGSPAIEEWKYLPALQFLRMHVKPRKIVTNCKEELCSPSETQTSSFYHFDEYLPETDNLYNSTFEASQSSVSTPSTSRGAKKRKIMEHAMDRFEDLLGTVTDYLSTKAAGKSRNEDFYKVLDSYLLKLSTDVQDEIKLNILKIVIAEMEKKDTKISKT